MEIRYYCPDRNCQKNEKGPYIMTLQTESVMDSQNIAHMFCPRCRCRLEPCAGDAGTAWTGNPDRAGGMPGAKSRGTGHPSCGHHGGISPS